MSARDRERAPAALVAGVILVAIVLLAAAAAFGRRAAEADPCVSIGDVRMCPEQCPDTASRRGGICVQRGADVRVRGPLDGLTDTTRTP